MFNSKLASVVATFLYLTIIILLKYSIYFSHSLSPMYVMNFKNGLRRNDLLRYDFILHGSEYRLYAVVQFIKKYRHFVLWIRDIHGCSIGKGFSLLFAYLFAYDLRQLFAIFLNYLCL